MTDKRTEIEIRMHILILVLLDYFEFPRKIGREEFAEIMGKMRDIRVMLDNKRLGCWSGHHAGYCNCTRDHTGHFVRP